MIKEIRIPEIGENVKTGDVVKVLVKVGDMVELDQSLIELETDKAVVEIPSPERGKITELTVKAGDQIEAGAVIARIDTQIEPDTFREEEGRDSSVPKEPEAREARAPKEEHPEPKPADRIEKKPPAEPAVKAAIGAVEKPEDIVIHELAPAAPSVRRLARELGVDINRVHGTGPGGRISPDDVKNFVKAVVQGGRGAGRAAAQAPPLPDFSKWGQIETEPISKVRKITAESMANAWATVVHVTQFDKADITELQKAREKHGAQVEQAGGKLTITAILLKVLAAALKTYPRFNASLDLERGEIIYKNYYHIGIAVDTDRGLLVPVIRDVDKKGIVELAVELVEVAQKARDKKITADQLEGGTFTISNQGGIGGTDFTPIVYWPQAAILGVSQASMQPVYNGRGAFEPRLILPLALSYDHRVNDGADAARFLRWVVNALDQPIIMLFD